MCSSSNQSQEERILYRQVKSLKASQIQRFKIQYFPPATNQEEAILNPPNNLWIKIKNKESIALRAAYLAGPYVLYVDCKPDDYDPNKKCFITADQPVFEPQLLPGQSFYAELSCHTFKERYCWVVDVISQILFNNTIDIDFEITIGTSKEILHEASNPESKVLNRDRTGLFEASSTLSVSNQDTLDLWNLPVPDTSRPIHLVILTHGLHSNVGTDMLYLKEEIDKVGSNDNIVVKGFFGNICKTERGIKYLGSRVAEYIVDLVTKNETFNNGKVGKISFIAHSLGGLVQTFAIAYLKNNFPWFFENIQPINFIALSSPLLGVVNENPSYVNFALSAGLVGKTGQDLGLKFLEKDSKPLLLLLPTGHTHQVLKRFARRTVYANVINDGIVPLRTSALLFLDYKGLSEIMNSKQLKEGKSNKIPANKDLEVKGEEQNNNADTNMSSPVQAMISYFMPQKQQKQPHGRYRRYQTAADGEMSNSAESSLEALPKASVFETATSLILPPLPSLKYITNPDARENVVIHDRLYKEDDLPPTENSSDKADTKASKVGPEPERGLGIRQRLLNTLEYSNVDTDTIEEDIAREYHKNMEWRKVLVKLKPDAHNNIIVRRRFSNAYGWPVIEHLVKNHFDVDPVKEASSFTAEKLALTNNDSLDAQLDLSSVLSRDLISRQNEDIDREKETEKEKKSEEMAEMCEHTWINSKDNSDSIFAVGPTGLLSDVSELMGNLRDHWYNYGTPNVSQHQLQDEAGQRPAEHKGAEQEPINESRDTVDEIDQKDGDLGMQKSLMNDFI